MIDISEFNSVDVVFLKFSKRDETNCLLSVQTLVREVDEVPIAFQVITVVDILNDVILLTDHVIGGEVVETTADEVGQASVAWI